jgi:AbrB family looped-hinge helix DNA binding protein
MAKKRKSNNSCTTVINSHGCCNIESLITLDERGQMVLPKEVRDRAKIRPGDKLAVVTWIKDGKTCCISLIKAEEFSEILRGVLEPMVKELIKK